jgi:tripartite ATP-independent transporter DctP family solute receptor
MSTHAKKIWSVLPGIVLVVFIISCGGQTTTAVPAGGGQATTTVPAQPAAQVLTLKLGSAAAPDQPAATACDRLAERIKLRTNGQLIVETYHNSALGEEDELVESCIMGTVDIIFCSGAPVTGHVKEFLTVDLPFAFKSVQTAYAYYDGEMGNLLFEKAKDIGLIGLTYLENGFRNMTNIRREIRTPADMKGLKMRTMNSAAYMAMMRALGAAPTPIPYGELYTALQQRVVDGQENPIANIDSLKMYEVQKYVTLTQHTYDPNVTFLSAKTRVKMTDEQFNILKEEMKRATKESRDENNAKEEEILKKFESAGVVVIRLSDAQKQLFADATKNVYKEFESTIGAEFMEKYLKATRG